MIVLSWYYMYLKCESAESVINTILICLDWEFRGVWSGGHKVWWTKHEHFDTCTTGSLPFANP